MERIIHNIGENIIQPMNPATKRKPHCYIISCNIWAKTIITNKQPSSRKYSQEQ